MTTTIYRVSGTLMATSAVHVGADTDGLDVDANQFVDGLGRVTIPGTSLAGVIRSLIDVDEAGAAPDGTSKTLWGTLERASRITVYDAWVDGPPVTPANLDIRTSSSIDRQTGGPAERHLFSRRLVPKGTRFRFRLDIEGSDTEPSEKPEAITDMLGRILRNLAGDGFAVGAGVTRGLGRITLVEGWQIRTHTLRRDTLRDALESGSYAAMTVGRRELPGGTLRITVPWSPVGPVMSSVSEQGAAADDFPLTATQWDRNNKKSWRTRLALVIPGSSVKGVLRSHAERIARGAAGITAVPDAFLEQLEGAGLPAISELFGTARERSAEAGPRGRKGSLVVHDVTSVRLAGTAEWERLRDAAAGEVALPDDRRSALRGAQDQADANELAKAIDAFNKSQANPSASDEGIWLDVVTRNSIDRWTGAAAEKRLFTVIEPHASWTPIVIDLDVARLRRQRANLDAALALLILVLIDAAEGWLAIGHATTRGLGSVRIDPTEVMFALEESERAKETTDSVAALDRRSLQEVLDDPELLERLTRAWTVATEAAAAQGPENADV
ncbi:RAMP superfamily CRISPR-associated protein [Millisia brevis]|uniref:RAMP superfamily CRISPR-associated protein n=1 Tax=Millisia brevis TaxID=264148 RepID=UPI00082B7517|nr:RAMP superfamily CRISPR-associated protein [Millisia brevis]